MSKTSGGIEVRFERVNSFCKVHGMPTVDGYVPVSHIASDKSLVDACTSVEPVQFLADMIFYSKKRKILMQVDKEAKAAEMDLERSIISTAGIFEHSDESVDLIVVSVYNTAISVVGNELECSGMCTIIGYHKV